MQNFFVDNLVTSAFITATSENFQYPLSNLRDERRTKVYRSTGNKVVITFDFGIARDIDAILVVDNGNKTLGFISAKVELNMVDHWATPPASYNLNLDHKHGFGHANLPTTGRYRYARVTLENTGGYCELSKIFIGEAVKLGEISFSYPITYRQNNNATSQVNRLRQKFIDEVNTLKEIDGSINTLNKEELDPILEMIDRVSFTRPLWLYFPPNEFIKNNMRLCGYYYLKDDPTLSLAVGNYWSLSLKLEEGA